MVTDPAIARGRTREARPANAAPGCFGRAGTGQPVGMAEDRNEVVTATAHGDRSPIAGDPPSTRRRRIATVVAGGVGGYVIGGIAVFLDSQSRYTGQPSHPETWIFGLPLVLAIIGTIGALLVDGARNSEDVDAPVRLRRFRRQGRAATSVRGQTPGSDVPPRYAPDAADDAPQSVEHR
jgi:hypothetical protein